VAERPARCAAAPGFLAEADLHHRCHRLKSTPKDQGKTGTDTQRIIPFLTPASVLLRAPRYDGAVVGPGRSSSSGQASGRHLCQGARGMGCGGW